MSGVNAQCSKRGVRSERNIRAAILQMNQKKAGGRSFHGQSLCPPENMAETLNLQSMVTGGRLLRVYKVCLQPSPPVMGVLYSWQRSSLSHRQPLVGRRPVSQQEGHACFHETAWVY